MAAHRRRCKRIQGSAALAGCRNSATAWQKSAYSAADGFIVHYSSWMENIDLFFGRSNFRAITQNIDPSRLTTDQWEPRHLE
jgi:hypothetical protein